MKSPSTVPDKSSALPTRVGDPPWWRGAVIYQIYPRSFQDSNGDGIGDLPGIVARLDHVATLGADAIWVSPFCRSPMKDFGYDVADYRDVDPLFGSLADFDHLLARAHELGLRVMIDQVLSHTSDQHIWFQQSRANRNNAHADWYVWAGAKPDGSPPNNWLSVFGGSAWTWDARRKQYYLHQFLAEQPDLNFHHPDVQEQLLAEVRFWCERGVDGFRFDACNHQFSDTKLRDNPPARGDEVVSTVSADNPYAMQRHLYDKSQPENLAFLERLRHVLDEFGAIAMGEVGDENAPPLMAQYTEAGKRLHMAYSFALVTHDGSAGHIRHQVETLTADLNATGGWGCWAFSNHDSERVASRWARTRDAEGIPQIDARQDRMLWALLSSLRGSVCVYEGEELGLPQADVPFELLQDPYGKAFWPEFKGRDGCRTPIPWQANSANAGFTNTTATPWLPIPPVHRALAVDIQETDPTSTLHFARAWLGWRRDYPLLRDGGIRYFDTVEDVLLFVRYDENAVSPTQKENSYRPSLLMAFNLSDTPRRLDLHPCGGKHVWEDITPDFVEHGGLGGHTEGPGKMLILPPFGLWIATQTQSLTHSPSDQQE